MSEWLLYALVISGGLVWLVFAAGCLWLAYIATHHAAQAWIMAGRVAAETSSRTRRIRWWVYFFWRGPFTSLTTADGDHTVYWPGCEPKGWYSDSPPKKGE